MSALEFSLDLPDSNIQFFQEHRGPKYVLDMLVYPQEKDMQADRFLSNHSCFSKISVNKEGEYLVTCSASPEKIINSISRIDSSDQLLAERAVEVLQEEFMRITDAIRFVNSHVNVEFDNYEHVILLINYFQNSN